MYVVQPMKFKTKPTLRRKKLLLSVFQIFEQRQSKVRLFPLIVSIFMMYFSFLASFGSWAITNDTEHSTRGEVFLNKYPSKIENSSNIVVETFLRYVYSFQAWRYISFWIFFF